MIPPLSNCKTFQKDYTSPEKSLPQEIWFHIFSKFKWWSVWYTDSPVIKHFEAIKCYKSLVSVSQLLYKVVQAYRVFVGNQGKRIGLLGVENIVRFSLQHRLTKFNVCHSDRISDIDMQFLAVLGKSVPLLRLSLETDWITDEGLHYLQNSTALQRLDLTHCTHISGRSIRQLSRLTALRNVNLGFIRDVYDRDLQWLSRLTDLQKLSLMGCDAPTTKFLPCIAKLTNLRKLSLSYISFPLQNLSCLVSLQHLLLRSINLSKDNFRYLSSLTRLQRLIITCYGQNDVSGLHHLSKLTTLQKLLLGGLTNGDGWHMLAQLVQLQKLQLEECNQLTGKALQHISALTALQTLNLEGCILIDNCGLKHLRRLTNLQKINLQECTLITDAGLRHLALLTKIKHLDLLGCNSIKGEGFLHLSPLSGLKILKFNNETGYEHLIHLNYIEFLLNPRLEVGDEDFKYLTRLPRLQFLTLQCAKISDVSLEHLKHLPLLEMLELRDCSEISAANMEFLSSSKCRGLVIHYTHFNEIGLKYIHQLSRLEFLTIKSDHIDDEMLSIFAACPSLQVLELDHCHLVTDEGLKYLSKRLSLRALGFRYCPKITTTGFKYIAALPELLHLLIYDNAHINSEILALFPRLKQLHFLMCPQISSCALHFLKLKHLG